MPTEALYCFAIFDKSTNEYIFPVLTIEELSDHLAKMDKNTEIACYKIEHLDTILPDAFQELLEYLQDPYTSTIPPTLATKLGGEHGTKFARNDERAIKLKRTTDFINLLQAKRSRGGSTRP
ncbi:MAG: hypothetical protein WDA42_06885 [Candidatus Bathyarchaeia archaeon]